MAKKSTYKVLYIITKSVWGGAAKYVFDLATNLPKNQFEVFVAGGRRDKFAQKTIEAKLPYFEISGFQRNINLFKEILAFFEILKLIFKLKPDTIHANSSKAGGIAGLAGWIYKIITRRSIKLIFTAHGWAINESRSTWQIFLIRLSSRLTSLFYDKIICVSEYDRQIAIFNDIAPNKKLITIHNGLDFKNINFLTKEQAQQKLLNKTAPLVIGTIAEWTKNKGLFYLLEAIKDLNKTTDKKPEVVLIGSGENPDKTAMRNFIKDNKLDNVRLFEWLENAALYLKAFDIFVLPSLKEGLPFTILEAMAAEVPIVATFVGGVPEMIEHNQSGLLIESKNPLAIKKAIIYFLDNPDKARVMAKLGREKIEREFGLERMMEETRKAYQ